MDLKPALIFILMLIVAFSVFSENVSDNLRIGIILIENPGEDPGLESLCETATDTIELTLRLVNKYTVERLDFLMPETNLDRAKIYFKSNGFDNAVFGEIKRNEYGEYTFLIKGWERESDSIIVETEDTADSVFDMFDIVDNLTIEFIEELSGEHIGFGKIIFINEGAEADYNIYVDGNYLGRNIEKSEILFGERTFKITAPGRFGDTVVETITVEVEENSEQNIVFSMGEAEPALSSLGSDEIVSMGNLFIDAKPENSEVFLDNQSIGFTPLSLYGVGAGLYDLRVGSEYYLPATQVLRLEPNIDNTLSFDLGIDIEHPDIKKQLKDPDKIALLSAALSLGQMAWYTTQLFFIDQKESPADWWYIDYLVMSPRYGHLLAGDEFMGTTLSLANFAVYLGFSGMFDTILPENFVSSGWDTGIYTSALVGLMLYDLIFASSSASKQNSRLIDRFKTEGVDLEKRLPDPFRITVQAGGGGIIHGGVSWAPFWDWLYFEQLAGIALTQYVDILKPALSMTSKIYAYPFNNSLTFFKPYIGILFNISTDFSSFDSVEAALDSAGGLTSGFDIAIDWFDIFIEADLYFSNAIGTVPSLLAIGVRL